ncbi:MAG: PQQ-binding-like beta-propeller repeat protein [Gemmataceae bacterium]|nr:PQQ-binding-like beta-propeller repeat protein [Gemmataceae bacterium]
MIRLPLILSLACCLYAVGSGPSAQPAPERLPPPRALDLSGDELPPGALARLGTIRFRHGGPVTFVAFAPDGKTVVSGSGQGHLHLWETATGKLLHQIPNQQYASSVVFTPDGKGVALIGSDSHFRLHDLSTGKEVRRLSPTTRELRLVAFSAGGKRAALVAQNHSIRVWDLETDREVRQLVAPQPNPTFAPGLATLSADGKLLAIAGPERGSPVVRLWEVDSGRELPRIPLSPNGAAALAFSPDGKRLAIADNKSLTILDVASREKVYGFDGVPGAFLPFTFSADGKLLALRNGQKIDLIETAGWTTLRSLTPSGVPYALAFSADGKMLAVGGSDNVVRLCDTATGKELRPTEGHQAAVARVAYAPDGRSVATASADGTVRLWEAATGKELRSLSRPTDKDAPRPGAPSALTFLDGGKVLAGAWGDGRLCVWETATGKQRQLTRAPAGHFQVVAFSPEGALLAAVGQDGMLRLRDVATGREVRRFARQQGPGMAASVVAFGHDGRTIATGHGQQNPYLALTRGMPTGYTVSVAASPFVRLWEVTTARERGQIHPEGSPKMPIHGGSYHIRGFSGGSQYPQLYGPVSNVSTLVFAPDGKTLAVATTGGAVRLWDLNANRERQRIDGQPYAVPAVAFDPAGKVLAVTQPGTLSLYDTRTGEALCHVPTQQGFVPSLAFAPDGKTLVTGGGNTTALVWDVPRLLKEGRKPGELSAQELEKLWTELGDQDAGKGYRAGWSLAAVPARSIPFLAERLRPVPLVGAERIARLVADLDSARYSTRQQAERELQKLGDLAEPALRRTLEANPSLEMRRRIEALLERAEGPISAPEPLRSLRAVEVLERIGTPEARRVLQRLADGEPEALVTREARAALQRLERRAAASR